MFDASTGDVVAEWGGDGERTDAGVGATAGFSRGWRRSERDEPRPVNHRRRVGMRALDGAFGGRRSRLARATASCACTDRART